MQTIRPGSSFHRHQPMENNAILSFLVGELAMACMKNLEGGKFPSTPREPPLAEALCSAAATHTQNRLCRLSRTNKRRQKFNYFFTLEACHND
jgi:hypothetical protein